MSGIREASLVGIIRIVVLLRELDPPFRQLLCWRDLGFHEELMEVLAKSSNACVDFVVVLARFS